MLQPFEKFRTAFIERLLMLGKWYIISQTYKRGHAHFEDVQKTGILLTDYADPGIAKTHLNAIRHDRYACMLNLTNEAHANKIRDLMHTNSLYLIYWPIVRDPKELKKNINLKYSDHLRRYITSNTDWRISADETIRPSMQVIFGELFIVLKRGRNHELRIKFEDIEKC